MVVSTAANDTALKFEAITKLCANTFVWFLTARTVNGPTVLATGLNVPVPSSAPVYPANSRLLLNDASLTEPTLPVTRIDVPLVVPPTRAEARLPPTSRVLPVNAPPIFTGPA